GDGALPALLDLPQDIPPGEAEAVAERDGIFGLLAPHPHPRRRFTDPPAVGVVVERLTGRRPAEPAPRAAQGCRLAGLEDGLDRLGGDHATHRPAPGAGPPTPRRRLGSLAAIHPASSPSHKQVGEAQKAQDEERRHPEQELPQAVAPGALAAAVVTRRGP